MKQTLYTADHNNKASSCWRAFVCMAAESPTEQSRLNFLNFASSIAYFDINMEIIRTKWSTVHINVKMYVF